MDLTWPVIGLLIVLGLYLAGIAALLLMSRRQDARALAGFVPDCDEATLERHWPGPESSLAVVLRLAGARR